MTAAHVEHPREQGHAIGRGFLPADEIAQAKRAADSPVRGEWVFRDGQPVPLGPEPEICRYELLRERPGPFYIEEDWTGELATQLSRSKTSASLRG